MSCALSIRHIYLLFKQYASHRNDFETFQRIQLCSLVDIGVSKQKLNLLSMCGVLKKTLIHITLRSGSHHFSIDMQNTRQSKIVQLKKCELVEVIISDFRKT